MKGCYVNRKAFLAVLTSVSVLLALLMMTAVFDHLFSGNRLRGNPFTTGDFQLRDGYLTCLTEPAVRGIDVSEHQGQIDWEAVRESGVEFVILRVGFRGYGSAGNIVADANAQENYRKAKAAGLQVGAYFFSQAVSPEEAEEEADFFLAQTADWELDLWAVYDWEYMGEDARTADVDARTLTDCTIAFSEKMAAAGHTPMVYFNRTQSERKLYMEELAGYQLWLAMYHDPIETFLYRPDMWQYTNTGNVPGIAGNVDINLWFLEDGERP